MIPKVDAKLWEAPKGLNKEAVQAWNMAVASAPDGWLTALDASVLEQWARDYAMFRRLQSQIDHEGFTIETAEGTKPHPLFPVLFKAKAALLADEKELGFTPTSRARVRVNAESKEENEFDGF